jgi:hypothetical protein
MATALCDLEHAIGRTAPCPGDPCPFWSDARCVIAGLRADLGATPGLPQLLLRVRDAIGSPAGRAFPQDRALLPPGLRD